MYLTRWDTSPRTLNETSPTSLKVLGYRFIKGLKQNLGTNLKLEYNIKSLNFIQQNFRFQASFLSLLNYDFYFLWHYHYLDLLWLKRYTGLSLWWWSLFSVERATTIKLELWVQSQRITPSCTTNYLPCYILDQVYLPSCTSVHLQRLFKDSSKLALPFRSCAYEKYGRTGWFL